MIDARICRAVRTVDGCWAEWRGAHCRPASSAGGWPRRSATGRRRLRPRRGQTGGHTGCRRCRHRPRRRPPTGGYRGPVYGDRLVSVAYADLMPAIWPKRGFDCWRWERPTRPGLDGRCIGKGSRNRCHPYPRFPRRVPSQYCATPSPSTTCVGSHSRCRSRLPMRGRRRATGARPDSGGRPGRTSFRGEHRRRAHEGVGGPVAPLERLLGTPRPGEEMPERTPGWGPTPPGSGSRCWRPNAPGGAR